MADAAAPEKLRASEAITMSRALHGQAYRWRRPPI